MHLEIRPTGPPLFEIARTVTPMAADCAHMAPLGFPNGSRMDPKCLNMLYKSTLGRPQDGAENLVAKKYPKTATNRALLSPRANYERNLARPGRHFGTGWVF